MTGSPARPEEELLAFPLSPGQHRMWVANEEWPGNPAYNASFRWTLDGPLDLSALQRSFNEIVGRHEVLRTTFGPVDGVVHQLVQPSLRLLMPVTDLRSVPAASVDDRIEQICTAEAERSFNLERGPLIRVGLLRVRDTRYILMLTLHHIICDGWSIGVIMRELQQIYSADVDERPSPLPPLPIQFSDYVIWHSNQDAELRKRDLAYWKATLQGSRRFRLPSDLPDASDRSIKSTIVSRLLSREITERLKGAINRHSGTMFTLTFAACLALLNRQTGTTDLAVGTPLAGRDRSEIEGLIGLFVNPAVLRVDLAGDPTFIELAIRVRETLWDALAHQSVAFETVIDALPAANRPQSGPFYTVNFVCQRAFGGSINSEFDFSGIDVTPMPSRSPGGLFDLNFFLIERDSGWRVSLEYKTDRYSPAIGDRLLDEFCCIVAEIADHPDKRLSQLLAPDPPIAPARPAVHVEPLLTQTLQQQASIPEPERAISPEFEPETNEVFELPASASQFRFWRLSRIWPDSPAFNMPAVVRISGPLSADHLGRALQAVVDRHEILRTTFKELDGELRQLVVTPAEIVLQRTELRDADGGQGELSGLLAEHARRLFDLERGPLLRAHLLYLGEDDHVLIVCMHHIISDGWSQNILQRELWTVYEALARTATPELAPLPIQYADFAVWQNEWLASEQAVEHLDYWMTTLNGSLPVLDFPTDHPPGQRPSVHGAVQSHRLDEHLVERLKAAAQSANVTMFMLTVSAFAVLLERFTGQPHLIIGAPSANRNTQTEPLIGPFSGPIALRLDLAGDPTFGEVLKRVSQVTMDALDHAVYPFESIMERLKMRSVQGRNPLFQFYFLYQTAFLQPHQAGDLVVTPVPTPSFGNPFELQLAVIERHDGVWANLEYNQGLFEPASIQNVLTYFVSVLEAMAAATSQTIASLKPPTIAQRTPAAAAERTARPYVGPRSTTEAKLVAIWGQLFELPNVSVCEDFFDLGGHSLMAASLMSIVEREFGTKVDLSNLLLNRTIEQLGRLIDGGNADCLESSLVPLRATGSRTPLFCVHGGGGHVLAYQALAESLPSDQPVYGLAAPELDGAKKAMSVPELASLYNQEIKRVQAHGPYRLCGYSFGGTVAVEMAAQLVAAGEVVEFIVMLDTANSGYYRNLPWSSWIQFWTTRVFDRIHRYYRRFADHKASIAFSSASYFVRKNVHERFWSISRRLFRIANRPMPVLLRDNVTMFKTTARGYQPTPVPAGIILFRVAERDPEYNHNASLGWELIAQKGVKVHYVPGDHLSFMRQPHVKRVAEQLVTYLV
jgi:non-ribosomal peptide synthetase component F/thioesterase domain-containing protein/acyl carrier protein